MQPTSARPTMMGNELSGDTLGSAQGMISDPAMPVTMPQK